MIPPSVKDALFKALISTLMVLLGAYLISDVIITRYKINIAKSKAQIELLNNHIKDLQKSNNVLQDKLYNSISSDSAHFYALEQSYRSNINNTHNGGIKTANRINYLTDDSLSELFSKYNGK